MGHRSVARGIAFVGGVGIALAVFVNATKQTAYWSYWVMILFLAFATLATLVRTPRSPALIGFVVFGWCGFYPTAKMGETPPTEQFFVPLAEMALKSRRPGPLPAGFWEERHDDGTISYRPLDSPSLPSPAELQEGGSVYDAYWSYNERLRACLAIGDLISVVALGLIGAGAGTLLARRPNVPDRETATP